MEKKYNLWSLWKKALPRAIAGDDNIRVDGDRLLARRDSVGQLEWYTADTNKDESVSSAKQEITKASELR